MGKDQVQTELWPTFADQESTLALMRELLVCGNCQFADVKRAPDWVLVSPEVAPQLCYSVSTGKSSASPGGLDGPPSSEAKEREARMSRGTYFM